MHLFYDFLLPKMKSVILKQACSGFFKKKWEPVINISWLKNEQVKVCFFTLESPYPYFCCNLRHNVMPYMYSEMQNKLSKIRDSPLESLGQIISSRCPTGLLLPGGRHEGRIWQPFSFAAEETAN